METYSQQFLHGIDNGSRTEPEMIDEFVRLPAVRNLAHRDLLNPHAFASDGSQHRIAKPAMSIMILDRENPILRGLRAL